MISIVERGCASLEGCVVEAPFRRGKLPDELREFAPIFVIAGAAALCREVKLVPPLQLGVRRERRLPALLAPDQITAHRNKRLAALWPEHGDNVASSRSPIETGDDCLP